MLSGLHPSLKCAATDAALTSLTLVFQRPVPLRSLNSLPQQRQRRNRILILAVDFADRQIALTSLAVQIAL